MTNRIRAMVYCLLDGAELVELQFAYKRKSSARLVALVELPDGHKEPFESHDPSPEPVSSGTSLVRVAPQS